MMNASTEVEEIIETRLRDLEEQLRPLAALKQERARLELALEMLRGGPANERAGGHRAGAGRRKAAEPATGHAQAPKRRATQPRSRRGRQAGRANPGRASPGSNPAAILEHVTAHPGATAGQLSTATGISRGVVYSAVSRLTAEGRLRRERLDDGQVGYHLP